MTVLGGRYELGALLGRGGMAEVYRARDTVLGRDVAVKVFRHVEGLSADDRRTGEVQLLAGLSHPGLVTVFDAGRDADAFGYLVMEYVPGTTLRDRLELGPLPPEETARLGAELAEALAYVHARGIVHRDVKPANILLATDGTAKLTDFGVAKLLDGTRLTVTGTTLGTPNYLSPEQATGAPVTGASDVYSLGLVLLECLTGQIAFPGHGVEAAVVRLHRDPSVPETLGAPWTTLLPAMTAREPTHRPEPALIASTLHVATGDTSTVPTATTQLIGPVAALPGHRRRWLPVAVGATVAAILALAAALAISAGTGDPSTSGSPAAPATSTSAPPTSTAATTPRTTTHSTARSTPTPAPKPPKPKPPPKKKGGHGKGHGKHKR